MSKTLNDSMSEFIQFINTHKGLDDFVTAHNDIQKQLATKLADEVMAIVGYDENRPEIEDMLIDMIYDGWELEER